MAQNGQTQSVGGKKRPNSESDSEMSQNLRPLPKQHGPKARDRIPKKKRTAKAAPSNASPAQAASSGALASLFFGSTPVLEDPSVALAALTHQQYPWLQAAGSASSKPSWADQVEAAEQECEVEQEDEAEQECEAEDPEATDEDMEMDSDAKGTEEAPEESAWTPVHGSKRAARSSAAPRQSSFAPAAHSRAAALPRGAAPLPNPAQAIRFWTDFWSCYDTKTTQPQRTVHITPILQWKDMIVEFDRLQPAPKDDQTYFITNQRLRQAMAALDHWALRYLGPANEGALLHTTDVVVAQEAALAARTLWQDLAKMRSILDPIYEMTVHVQRAAVQLLGGIRAPSMDAVGLLQKAFDPRHNSAENFRDPPLARAIPKEALGPHGKLGQPELVLPLTSSHRQRVIDAVRHDLGARLASILGGFGWVPIQSMTGSSSSASSSSSSSSSAAAPLSGGDADMDSAEPSDRQQELEEQLKKVTAERDAAKETLSAAMVEIEQLRGQYRDTQRQMLDATQWMLMGNHTILQLQTQSAALGKQIADQMVQLQLQQPQIEAQKKKKKKWRPHWPMRSSRLPQPLPNSSMRL